MSRRLNHHSLSTFLQSTNPQSHGQVPHPCCLSQFALQNYCGGLVAKWTTSHQAPLSTEFPPPENWTRLSFPSPGGSSQIRNRIYVSYIAGDSHALQVDSLFLSHQRSHIHHPRGFPCCSVVKNL